MFCWSISGTYNRIYSRHTLWKWIHHAFRRKSMPFQTFAPSRAWSYSFGLRWHGYHSFFQWSPWLFDDRSSIFSPSLFVVLLINKQTESHSHGYDPASAGLRGRGAHKDTATKNKLKCWLMSLFIKFWSLKTRRNGQFSTIFYFQHILRLL